ncbi:MAG: hypothetical protein GY803_10305 [Chloroflexi bacterium]|nr:hypothetical protein [Chloroflexota bacterium]
MKTMQYRKKRKKQEGQALVEFALIVIPLVLLLVGGVEIVSLIIQWQSLHQVAEWGVREAAKDGGGTERVTTELTAQMLVRGIDPDMVTVNIFAVKIADDGVVSPVHPETQLCDFGGDIAVELRQPWRVSFLKSVVGESEFVALHTLECWRGRIQP